MSLQQSVVVIVGYGGISHPTPNKHHPAGEEGGRQEVEGEVGVEDPGGGGGVQLGVVLLPVLAANHAGTLEEGATLSTTC